MRIALAIAFLLSGLQTSLAADLEDACLALYRGFPDLHRLDFLRSSQDGRHVVLALREPETLRDLVFIDCYFADTSTEPPQLVVLQMSSGRGTVDGPIDKANELIRREYAAAMSR